MTPSPANPESAGPLRELIAKYRQTQDRYLDIEYLEPANALGEFIDELEALLPAIESARLDVAAKLDEALNWLLWWSRNITSPEQRDAIKVRFKELSDTDARAALDSLIETAIEGCKKAVEDASDDPIPEGTCSNGDQEEGYHDGVCCTLNNIFKRLSTITPASVKAEHALREGQGKGGEDGR